MRLLQVFKFVLPCLILLTIVMLMINKWNSTNVDFDDNSKFGTLIHGMDFHEIRSHIAGDSSKFCQPKYGNVTIFIAVDNLNLAKTKYKEAMSSLTCYAKRRGYKLLIIDAFKDELTQQSCSKLKSLLFLRHCASAVYLSKTNWLMVLDADNGVINFDHCIEEYIRPELNVIHSERFHNGEITASNYIVKNTQFSYNYLMQWSEYENSVPQFVNYDNGALHFHILKSLQLDWVSDKMLAECEKMGWRNSTSSGYQFVGCIKKALRGKRNFKLMKIYRRGLGFARDSWVTRHKWSELDFMLHAMKPPDNVHFESDIDIEQCANQEWKLPAKSSLKISINDMVPLIKKADSEAVRKTPESLLNSADVSNCWPNCPEDIE